MRLLRAIARIRWKRFLIFYGITFLVALILLYVIIYLNSGSSLKQSWAFWKDILLDVITHPFFWFLIWLPYLLYLLILTLVRDFRRKRWAGLARGFAFKIVLPVLIFFGISAGLKQYRLGESFEYTWDHSVENKNPKAHDLYTTDGKQRGMHIFNGDSEDIIELKTNNFEWIILTPFIGQKQYNLPELSIPSQERFERLEKRYREIKQTCDSLGIRVMLKPHIWLRENTPGKWRSNIEMKNEEDWKTWFDSYEEVMLQYAQLAEDLGFQQFCIGTELETTVKQKPEKWKALIQKARAIYSGKITYAANWNQEYEEVPFWDKLDYIGIQAYFPLSDGPNPTVEELEASWRPFLDEIEAVSNTFDKPVLFTEMGYRSLKGTSQTPWEWAGFSHLFLRISKEEQYRCYEAFFNTVWQEPWFHGLHIWEWQGRMDDGDNTSFSVQYKPALNLIARRFLEANATSD